MGYIFPNVCSFENSSLSPMALSDVLYILLVFELFYPWPILSLTGYFYDFRKLYVRLSMFHFGLYRCFGVWSTAGSFIPNK